ncbi:MBL fold metallo-hydrolase [Pantoea sp. SoEX]|uniref:MBL fold metallo-hydrolase n=1 Tax=Pantoea sp. SoEX TaxID=2576763 RepID=UPI001356C19C|nr:MBL fold metallo-hydrolase [Pantoea sp. SoEX]MXP51021.1 MBL fold metallo-hydrolase [Pantoea sp. SoEX]
MNYFIIPVTSLMQNCCVICCKLTRESVVVDPGGNSEKIKKKLDDLNLKPSKILITHGHLDHTGAAIDISKFYKIPIFGPQRFDKFLLKPIVSKKEDLHDFKFSNCIPYNWLEDNDKLEVGSLTFEVIHCPGHTPGHIVYFYRKGRILISGDVIFNGSIGRTDFPRSNYQDLINSIKIKLLPLGDDITFIPGHGSVSTLGYERINNPFLN